MPAIARRLTGLFVYLLAAPSCGIEFFGGQSGDDGDVHPGGIPGPVSEPRPPVAEGCDDTTMPLDASQPTAFQYTASDLVARLVPPASPFFWVDYSSSSLDAQHTPGPGQDVLTVGLEVRSPQGPNDDGIEQVSGTPSQDRQHDCDYVRVNVPVWVTLSTGEGALDVRAPGYVTFYGPDVAELQAHVSPTEMRGSFAFDQVSSKHAAYSWELSGFTLFAHLWHGGSAGVLSPEFTARSLSPTSKGGSDVALPPPPTGPVGGSPNSIKIPDHWEAVGVWPRLEQCAPGVVRDVNDRVLGISVAQVLTTLGEYSTVPLGLETDATSSGLRALDVQFSAPVPSGLICVDVSLWDNHLNFQIPATLSNTAAIAAPPTTNVPFQLDVEASVAFSSTSSTSVELTRIHFERSIDEVVQSLPREQLELETSLQLNTTPVDYAQFWWTWFGDVSPKTGGHRATFLVTSPNAEQTAAVEKQIAEGGPGFSVGRDESGQLLPGDAIFQAISAP